MSYTAVPAPPISAWRRPPFTASLIAAGALVALMAVTRLRNHITIPIAFAIPVMICIWFRDRRIIWGMVAALLAITAIKFFGHLGSEDYVRLHSPGSWIVLIVDILLVAIMADIVVRVRRTLERRNIELDANNHGLSAREEEIARQNEELQSQTEELERQGDELRVANEDLASRERLLEDLLDLSRSLGGELGADRMRSRICDAAAHMLGGALPGAALLERRGGRLLVRSHSGFGPDGINCESIAWDGSFAALAIARGRPAYLDDIALRPDLQFPQPASGAPFRSVLAAPVGIRGLAVGVLEIYSRETRSWSENEMALIESLAAQASISLEAARLFEDVDQQRRSFEAVFHTLPIGLLVAEDVNCAHVRGNPAAAAMFKVAVDSNFSPLSSAVGRIPRTLMQENAILTPDHSPLLRAVLKGEIIQNSEVDLVFPDGRRVSLLLSAAPIFDAQRQIRGGVCAFVDISTLKQLQCELDGRRRDAEEASIRKIRFLAAVSHDIRTPANAINLLAELLRRAAAQPALAADIPEMAQELQASAMSLVHLVSDVLDVTRLDYGRIELQESEFPLQGLLEEQRRQLQPLADAQNLKLEVEPRAGDLVLHTDRVKLARILSNLIGNAIKFTEQGGIRIGATRAADGSVNISVADTGIGMAPEELPRIFDEFVQVKNPARDRNKGSGLGLAICKRLVSAISGTLDVQSMLHEGSTFTLWLPRSVVVEGGPRGDAAAPDDNAASPKSVLAAFGNTTPGAAPNAAPLAHTRQQSHGATGQNVGGKPECAEKPLAGLTLLLVEDHVATRLATRQILQSEGATVIEAPDGATGLRLLYETVPQVLLLDMMLPDIDGREILRSLQGHRPAALQTVVVLTGDVTAGRSDEVTRLGADGLIYKPIDLHKLVTLIVHRRACILAAEKAIASLPSPGPQNAQVGLVP